MRLIVNTMPKWEIDTEKYFVMTEDTEEHIGFMEENKNGRNESYFEITIFEPEVEKKLLLYRNIRERMN